MPRLRQPPNQAADIAEPEDFTPPTNDIEIELAPYEVGETEVDLAPKPDPSTAETPAALKADDNPLQQALEATRRAEELQRSLAEAQRQRDEAMRQARERSEELDRERGDREDAQYNSVLTAIAAEQATLDKAESDYEAFAASGDWAQAAKAQRAIATSAARIERLEDGKQSFEARREAAKSAPSPQPRQSAPSDDVEQSIGAMPIPDSAKDWLRSHREYVIDARKNSKLQAAHWDALDDAGGQMGTSKYFEALETRLGLRQEPQSQPEPPPQTQRRSMPLSAPVSRDVPSTSGHRQTSSKVTLTAEERQIARSAFTASDMTNEQKELLYAKNKQRLARERANGSYPQSERN